MAGRADTAYKRRRAGLSVYAMSKRGGVNRKKSREMRLTPTGQDPDASSCPGHVLFSAFDPKNTIVWVLVTHQALHGKLDNYVRPQHVAARLEIFRAHQSRIEAAASRKFEDKQFEYIEGLGPTVILQLSDL
jgi:hypothetical protein